MFLYATPIAVADLPEQWKGLEGTDRKKRKALEAIEYGLSDRVAWSFYAEVDELSIAVKVYGKKLRRAHRNPS